MTDHKHLVNMTEIGRTRTCIILQDDYYKNEPVYYLISGFPGTFDWNGECFDAVKCDKEGNVTEKHHTTGEKSIYLVDNWDDDGNFECIGYSTSMPDYPQASLDLIP